MPRCPNCQLVVRQQRRICPTCRQPLPDPGRDRAGAGDSSDADRPLRQDGAAAPAGWEPSLGGWRAGLRRRARVLADASDRPPRRRRWRFALAVTLALAAVAIVATGPGGSAEPDESTPVGALGWETTDLFDGAVRIRLPATPTARYAPTPDGAPRQFAEVHIPGAMLSVARLDRPDSHAAGTDVAQQVARSRVLELGMSPTATRQRAVAGTTGTEIHARGQDAWLRALSLPRDGFVLVVEVRATSSEDRTAALFGELVTGLRLG